MKRFALIALLGLTVTAAHAEGDASSVEAKAQACTQCHGPGGSKPIAPDYPVLAGQYASYLAKALHEYRDGSRKNPTMGAMAKPLSDADIDALAHYFEMQDSPLYTPTEQGETRK